MSSILAKGEYCISGSYDKTVRLWNPYREKCIKVYRGQGYQVMDVDVYAFSLRAFLLLGTAITRRLLVAVVTRCRSSGTCRVGLC